MIYFKNGAIATAYISGLPTQDVTIVQCGNGYVECELSTGERVIAQPNAFVYVSQGSTNPLPSLVSGMPYATVYGGPKTSTFLSWDGQTLERTDSSGTNMSSTMGTMFL